MACVVALADMEFYIMLFRVIIFQFNVEYAIYKLSHKYD